MKRNIRLQLFLLTTLCSLFFTLRLSAQSIQVFVTVPPPYPIHLEDYYNLSNQTIITVQNLTNEPQQIKLLSSITGDNGITANTKTTYIPNTPIILNPMETRVLTGGQMKTINGNLTENDMDITGVSVSDVMQTEVLPEGNYTVCVSAYEYLSGELLSGSSGAGCANIWLTHYDPPEIIVPAFEQEVIAHIPQFISFAWSPAGIASYTRYRFELVDMNLNNLNNINDAFENPAVQLHYQESNILMPGLQYDMSKPPLTEGHQYAVRVIAYDPSQNIQFKNAGRSPVSTFFYVNGEINVFNDNPDPPLDIVNNGPGETQVVNLNLDDLQIILPPPPDQDPPEDPGDCFAGCNLEVPPGPAISSLNANMPVQVGAFQMHVTQLNGPGTGTGLIHIDFLKTDVKVSFNNIQVNGANAMISGQVVAQISPGSVVSQAVASSENADIQQIYDDLPELLNEVNDNARRVSMFTGNQAAVDLPFTLDNKGFDMVIAGLIFKSDMAYMNVAMGIETMQNVNTPYFGLGQSGIGIRPNGFCEEIEPKISLLQNTELELLNNGNQEWVKMIFNGSQGGDKTYASFSCQGVEELRIHAELVFGRDFILPVGENGDVLNGELSIEIINTLNENLKDWYIESPAIKPTGKFTLPGLDGFVLSAQEVIYDQHGGYLSPGMSFHQNHPYHGNQEELWKGLYIGQLNVKFPEGFNKDGQPLNINAQNLLLDKTGMWGLVSVNNLLQIDQGDLGGWAFSIDNFSLDIQESQLAGGGFSGNIELPIADLGVPYTINLGGEDEGSYTIGISPGTDISVNMWIADLTIGNSSSIGITKPQNSNTFKPTATINGEVTIGWTGDKLGGMNMANPPAVSKFQLPTLGIEGMQISTENNQPKIDDFGIPQLDNLDLPQGEFFAFKINLSELSIVNDGQGSNGLRISLGLGFDDSGNEDGDPLIGGSTTFTLYPKVENKKFRFDKASLDAVSIAATVGPAELAGGIELFDGDPEYGDGFRGFINVSMPPVGLQDMNFTLQVGTAPENYRYWMFDASIKLTSGIPCGPGVAIYGFGGGAWYNMQRQGPENQQGNVAVNYNDMQNVSADDPVDMTPGGTQNGITYTPSEGTFGFKANVILGLVGSSAAFNADVGLAMELDTDFGFNFIEFSGKAYLMQAMDNRGEALITGEVLITVESKNVNPNGPVLTGHVGIGVNVETLVEIEADLNMDFMFSSSDWYVNFGSWDQQANPATYEPQEDEYRNKLAITIPVINVDVGFNSYFMVGTMVPQNLPPLPQNVQNFFPGGAKEPPGMEGLTASGLAFAAGAGVHLDVHLTYAILYADIIFDMGFDALVQKLEGDCGENGTVGIDGWYAKGQAYAYCHVAGGLEIDLWFFSGQAEFVSFTAGALLRMQAPNPTWVNGRIKFEVSILGGLVKVNTQMVADIGEKCDPGAGSPFDDIPIVAYVDPADKAQKVHCYTDPQIVFNFPREPFKLEVYQEGEDDWEYKGYSIELQDVSFSYIDPETDKEVQIEFSDPYYAQDGYSCRLLPKDAFPGLTEISYTVQTQGFEHKMNGYLVTDEKINSFPQQFVYGTFKTDSLPDVIMLENIVYSIPGLAQRYFLKDEEAVGKIKLGQQGCETLFRTEEDSDPDIMYVYKARFIELATNETYESDCQCNNFLVSYAIPNELNNSRIYQLDFVRQTLPKSEQNQETTSNEDWRKIGDWEDGVGQIALPLNYGEGGGGDPNEGGIDQIQIPPQIPNPNINEGMILQLPNQEGGGGMQIENMQIVNVDPNPNPGQMNFDIVSEINLPGDNNGMIPDLDIAIPEPQKMIAMEVYDREFVESIKTIKVAEKVLFTNYFKTSKYDTRQDKLDQLEEHNEVFTAEYPLPAAHFESSQDYESPGDYMVEVPVLLLKTQEGFDMYDIKGYFYSAIDPQELDVYENEDELYNIHPPIFQIGHPYNPTWLEDKPYDPDPYSFNESIFYEPDEEDYRYVWPIYDPTNWDNPEVPYKYFEEGDLREYIYWPDDWSLHYPTYFEDSETDDLGNVFWGSDRFRKLSYYDYLTNPSDARDKKYREPFSANEFYYVDKLIPSPQEVRASESFMAAEWYRINRHGPVDVGGIPLYEPEGNLSWSEINAEKAKAPQEGNNGMAMNLPLQNNPGNNGLNPMVMNAMNNGGFNFQANPTKYIAIIEFSEWMAKRDHIRINNKLLWDFREEICIGCGADPGKVLDIKDGGGQNYGNINPYDDNKPQDWNNDGIPDIDPDQFPYSYKYLPLRSFLLHRKYYKGRPAGELRFKIGEEEFLYNIPKLDTDSWATDYIEY
ncbi:MAG: hypothetical protein GYB31_04335 [Bacteroidetes bacterium]|nr:hypothetical protein [Bacteroidota bacterium]